MNIDVQISGDRQLADLIGSLGASNRKRLFSVAAKAVQTRVRGHLQRVAMTRHATAARLGARPTGHYRKGLSGVVGTATETGGQVVVPIPGVGRAYHDIHLATPTPYGKNWLTIPKHPAAYGRTVKELRARGWKIFRPDEKKILLGYRRKGQKPEILYTLAKTVRQRRDPSLLPQEEEIARVAREAMTAEIDRRLAAAQRSMR